MDVKKFSQGLSYCGQVDGKRQRYFVLRGSDYFLVLSFSRPSSGNFNVVSPAAVDNVSKWFAGTKGVTTSLVVQKAKKTRHAPNALAALNILYVVGALGRAKVDRSREGQKLFFDFKR